MPSVEILLASTRALPQPQKNADNRAGLGHQLTAFINPFADASDSFWATSAANPFADTSSSSSQATSPKDPFIDSPESQKLTSVCGSYTSYLLPPSLKVDPSLVAKNVSAHIATQHANWSISASVAKISKNILLQQDGSFVSKEGHHICLGPVFSSGAYGAVRMIHVQKQNNTTIYVGKQIPIGQLSSAGTLRPSKVSIGGRNINCVPEQSVYDEVAAMLKARTLLAPYIVLRNIVNAATDEADRIFLALPVMLGTVLDALNAVTEDQQLRMALASRVARMGATELTVFHNNNVAMRDIKPENMLIDSKGNIRLSDFGLSSQVSDAQGFCTTETYAPPELFALKEGRHLGAKDRYNAAAVDIWALGTTLAEIMMGANPFWGPFWTRTRPDHESHLFGANRVQDLRLGWPQSHNLALIWLNGSRAKPRPVASNKSNEEVQKLLFQTDHNYAALVMRMLHPQPSLRPTAQQVTELHGSLYLSESYQTDNQLLAKIRAMQTPASMALSDAQRRHADTASSFVTS